MVGYLVTTHLYSAAKFHLARGSEQDDCKGLTSPCARQEIETLENYTLMTVLALKECLLSIHYVGCISTLINCLAGIIQGAVLKTLPL